MPSINDLSTELDNHILSFLEHNSLEAMSRVSKYYRKVAEPCLYRHITIRAGDHARVKLLFLALVSRRELAVYLKSFEIEDSSSEEIDIEIEHFSQQLLGRLTDLQHSVHQALGQRSASEHLEWLGKAIKPGRHVVDTYVGLILSLAENIECIKLSLSTISRNFSKLERTCKAIALPRILLSQPISQRGAGDEDTNSLPTEKHSPVSNSAKTIHTNTKKIMASPSFFKLRHLRLKGLCNSAIPTTPSLENFHIRYSLENTIQWPDLSQEATAIHTIDFGQCDLPEQDLVHGTNAGYLKEVRVVRFVDTLYNTLGPQHHILTKAMADNMSKLEYLEWIHYSSGYEGGPSPRPPKNLAYLLNLTTLRIDFRLVAEPATFLAFIDPKSLLPPHLHTLHLSEVALTDLDSELRELMEDGTSDDWINTVLNLASAFPLRSLSMTLGCRRQGSSKAKASVTTVRILQDVAGRLSTMETYFGVYRKTRGNELVSPRLLGPGFLSEEWDWSSLRDSNTQIM